MVDLERDIASVDGTSESAVRGGAEVDRVAVDRDSSPDRSPDRCRCRTRSGRSRSCPTVPLPRRGRVLSGWSWHALLLIASSLVAGNTADTGRRSSWRTSKDPQFQPEDSAAEQPKERTVEAGSESGTRFGQHEALNGGAPDVAENTLSLEYPEHRRAQKRCDGLSLLRSPDSDVHAVHCFDLDVRNDAKLWTGIRTPKRMPPPAAPSFGPSASLKTTMPAGCWMRLVYGARGRRARSAGSRRDSARDRRAHPRSPCRGPRASTQALFLSRSSS